MCWVVTIIESIKVWRDLLAGGLSGYLVRDDYGIVRLREFGCLAA